MNTLPRSRPLSFARKPYRQRRSLPLWGSAYWGWFKYNLSKIAAVEKSPDNIFVKDYTGDWAIPLADRCK